MTSIAERLDRNRATYRPPAAELTGTDADGGDQTPGEVAPSRTGVEHTTPPPVQPVIADAIRSMGHNGWTPDDAAAEVVRRLTERGDLR